MTQHSLHDGWGSVERGWQSQTSLLIGVLVCHARNSIDHAKLGSCPMSLEMRRVPVWCSGYGKQHVPQHVIDTPPHPVVMVPLTSGQSLSLDDKNNQTYRLCDRYQSDWDWLSSIQQLCDCFNDSPNHILELLAYHLCSYGLIKIKVVKWSYVLAYIHLSVCSNS